MPIGNTNNHKHINLSEFIDKLSSIFSLNLTVKRGEMKAKLSFMSVHHFEFPNRNTGFIYKFNKIQCKHEFY